MGIFQEMITLVNRTSKQLEVVFDGQRAYIQPNYTAEGKLIPGVQNVLPKIVVPYVLNQNVLMGSEDAIDPSDFTSLVGIQYSGKGRKHSWHDCSYLEQATDKLTRVPLEDVLQDPNAEIQVRGKAIPRAGDAAINTRTTPFDPR